MRLLGALPDPQQDEWVTRFWCAKEAVAKALGTGALAGPSSVIVRKLDGATGMAEVVVGPGMAHRFPALAGVPLAVYTAEEGGWVVAAALVSTGARA